MKKWIKDPIVWVAVPAAIAIIVVLGFVARTSYLCSTVLTGKVVEKIYTPDRSYWDTRYNRDSHGHVISSRQIYHRVPERWSVRVIGKDQNGEERTVDWTMDHDVWDNVKVGQKIGKD
jgi:hypothetical protein